ncbi:hypothetical protein [Methylocystis sp. B8]|uniref:hypothetical protein n=1 Tax=Methylocystis sp. B8 TaxID=544938 RepID=UPI0010FD21F9|nr:hypothetical protein [Methylocystis sp. B8]TLG78599.1 hypothetical protein FEV16_00720 [Methylocystis sp. B8]
MSAAPEPQFATETVWIREYAATYLPRETGFTYTPEMLRRENVSVVDLRNVFRLGTVTYANKLDGPGALWIIEGSDGDGGSICAQLWVISETLEVTVRRVKRVKTLEEPGNAA